MSEWTEILDHINEISSNPGMMMGSEPFYRGHSDSTWELMPSLGRYAIRSDSENKLYYQFLSYGGHLIPAGSSTWDVLFLMQHHGLPTRLLDWTESFAVALYFAIRDAQRSAAVWVLNPSLLNFTMLNRFEVQRLESAFPEGYEKYFIDDRSSFYGKFPATSIAVSGKANSSRMRSQRAVFTLHSDIAKPLNTTFRNLGKVAWKVTIPMRVFEEARTFLKHAGINEFSIFPDLDGLGRHLRNPEVSDIHQLNVKTQGRSAKSQRKKIRR